jgi:hypothetical protein
LKIGFEFGDGLGARGAAAQREVVLAERRVLIIEEVALCVERLLAEVFADLRGRPGELAREVGLLRMRASLECRAP